MQKNFTKAVLTLCFCLRMGMGITQTCTTPPTAGNAIASQTNVCAATQVTLSLSGNSTGTGQTYQWQSSPTLGGTFSNIGTASSSTTLAINPTTSAYYLCQVTCSGMTANTSTVQVTVNPAFAGGTNYTINKNLATGGSNFQSFSDAVNAIKCGITGPVVFTVAPGSGTYAEQVTIPVIPGTSATNTISFIGNGNTLQYITTDGNNRTALILNGADHIIIDSLTISTVGGTYGWGILLTNGADSNTIRRCTINIGLQTTVNYAGLVMSGSGTTVATSGNNANGNLIERNTIYGGYYGIYAYGNNSSVAVYNRNNTFSLNKITDYYSVGMYCYAQDSILISKNDISRPTQTASGTPTYALYTYSTNLLAEKNKIHDLFASMPTSGVGSYAAGFRTSGISATNPNRVENNLVYGTCNATGTSYGIYCDQSNYKFYHNTISMDNTASTAGIAIAMYCTGSSVAVQNNIVSVTRGGTGQKTCLYYGTPVVSSNNNVLFMGSTGGTTNYIGYNNTNGYVAAFADWQATGSDVQSASINPAFTGPANLVPTEPTINNIGATGLGVTTDITDATRGSLPDPGAYEFSVGTLPVSLVLFEGSKQGNNNLLRWTTASEVNNLNFELQRSADGVHFSTITVIASEATGGNSSSLLAYSYVDAGPFTTTQYYRLKQNDKNGHSTLSAVVSLQGEKATELVFGQVYPNPARDEVTVLLSTSATETVNISITDIAGKTVMKRSAVVTAGDNTIRFNVGNWSHGQYVIAVTGADRVTATKLFLKQ